MKSKKNLKLMDDVTALKLAAKYVPKEGETSKDLDGNEWLLTHRRDTIEVVDGTMVLSVAVTLTRDCAEHGTIRIPTTFVMLADELEASPSEEAIHDYVEDAWRTFLIICAPGMEKIL